MNPPNIQNNVQTYNNPSDYDSQVLNNTNER